MNEGSPEGDQDVETGRLLALYRRYLGEPEQLSDVYVGFGLFFAGVTFAAVGLAVFLWSATLPQRPGTYWQLREIAVSLSMLGLPAFLLSVAVLLPVDRRAIYVGGLGGAVCLLAVGLFVANYPGNWNVSGPDASATGVTVYGLGLVVSTAAVGAALVSNYIERSEPVVTAGTAATEATAGDTTADTATVTDEQVRADIDEAVSAADLSWGGVEKGDTKRLKIQTDDADIDRSGFDTVGADENRAAGDDVEDAVDGLRKLRGGETVAATGEGTDNQADALRQLRDRQAREAAQSDEGLVDRLRERIGL